jgi:hypothetical protein
MQRGPGDCAEFGDRNERSQAPQVHGFLSPICINSQKNYVLDASAKAKISFPFERRAPSGVDPAPRRGDESRMEDQMANCEI